jgi:hypothetical protein
MVKVCQRHIVYVGEWLAEQVGSTLMPFAS